ncbi:MAG: hypothetical protein JKX85_03250 [Phycisphaeraceae bacterium]|nr:hypothetical protein [Phycisphaeraceae bacterium]
MLVRLTMVCICALIFSGSTFAAQTQQVKVRATGQAPANLPNAREAAIEDALRRCVEAGGGVELASASLTLDLALVEDAIYTKTAGYIQQYDVLQEKANDVGLYTVRVEAIVTRGNINADLMAFKALLKRKGHPRLMVVADVTGQPFEQRLTAMVQDMLEGKSITVIDTARLNTNQKRDAARAANGDQDLQKAAIIAQQAGADYLVTLHVEGEQHPVEIIHGIKMYAADAVGIVNVIATDTARVLASKVVERRFRSDSASKASRKGTAAAVRQAMREAMTRVAIHWLDDVDQREGQQIVIVTHQFSFERINDLVKKLRQVGGVKNVIIDRTDSQGTGQIRIATNSTTVDVASVLVKLDSKLAIISSTASRIDVKRRNAS